MKMCEMPFSKNQLANCHKYFHEIYVYYFNNMLTGRTNFCFTFYIQMEIILLGSGGVLEMKQSLRRLLYSQDGGTKLL
jgi:hypothetical protein